MSNENNISDGQNARVKKLIDDMTLFDDDLMTLVFNNVPAIDENGEEIDIEVQGNSKGLPIYRADRVVAETGQSLNDGAHIIYVNGAYKGDDDIGKLMHDFNSLTSEGMNYKELAEGIHHFKETEEGRDTMCESVKKYAEEYSTTKDIERVKIVMEKLKYSVDEALELLSITGEEKKVISQQLQK